MELERGFPLQLVWWIAVQDAVMTDDAAIDFIEPDFMPILHWMRWLAATDDIGMRLKNADDLFTSRHWLSLQHAPNSLLDHLLCTGHEGGQGVTETLSFSLGVPSQLRLGLNRPRHRFFGHFQQFLIFLPACLTRRLASLAEGFTDLASNLAGCLGEVLELLTHLLSPSLQDCFGTPHRARQHPHTVCPLATVRGRMHVRLHHRSIRAQLSTFGDFVLQRQLRDPLIEFLQGLRLDQIRPANQGCVIWHSIQIHATELPQCQTITDHLLRLFITVLV